MPKIPVLGRDDVVRRVSVAPANVARYAPLKVLNPKTGRMRTAFVKQDDTLLVRASSLDAESRVAAGVDEGNVVLTVTAGTSYTAEKPSTADLFIDATFSLVVPMGSETGATEAVEAALMDILLQSGLPVDSESVKIRSEVGEITTRPVGYEAGAVRMGNRRDRMMHRSFATDAARNALIDAVSHLVPDAPSEKAIEAKRRLTATKDANGRWRDSKGRFVKAPGTVVPI